ncbi:MAG: hypothetical protein M1821_000664 [Bathelium mastoideum]|nr:MAG: hypothetical protein M1821_000664 [Bathelium mastoideum]
MSSARQTKVRSVAKLGEGSSRKAARSQVPWPKPVSLAKDGWDQQKGFWKKENAPIDSLMELIGLEAVKRKFLDMNTVNEVAKQQGADRSKVKFGAVFIGNPGTGKSTVAKIYADFLYRIAAILDDKVLTTSGSRLISGGPQGCLQLLEDIQDGGVLLVEEAHHIMSPGSTSGGTILDLLLSEIGKLQGKVALVFAGYGKQMEALRGHNPAFPSLIPTAINFLDFLDSELHLLFVQEIKLRFKEKVKVEGGFDGLFMRIVARRIGRGRGRHGFGNAHEVQSEINKIHTRQARRLYRAMKAGTHRENDMFLLKREDLIGPRPAKAFNKSDAWSRLKGMIGLKAVKEAVEAMTSRLRLNYDRELAEMPLVDCSLNKLFLGNPGTGKTSVAKLYGQVLLDMGLLSSSEVVIKTPSDFIGEALGQSERNTRAILDSTKGKVLIIDEAYMLGGGKDRSTQPADSYRAAVIDTIVGEIQSTAVEDRCVLLLGYKDRMESMLNEGNEALTRRFPLASAFVFEDYSQKELRKILDLKLSEQGFRATDGAKDVCIEVLERARNRLGFGNAGEIDILLDRAKIRQHQRLLRSGKKKDNNNMFVPSDIDPDFERGTRSLLNIGELFNDFIGCDGLLKQLEGYQLTVRNLRAMKEAGEGKVKIPCKDPKEVIPFSFLFSGAPGTGKTTTAKRIGELFYDMGFLDTRQVMECSAADLIGEFVGHTSPKTNRVFDAALGRVLFIDEAYRLGDGQFGKEAMTQIVNNLTKERYQKKLVIILAGYEDDINKLMTINRGLDSRFPVVLKFPNLSVNNSIDLLFRSLGSHGLDVSHLKESQTLRLFLQDSFKNFSTMTSWGNARDVQNIAQALSLRAMRTSATGAHWVISEEETINEVSSIIDERRHREMTTRTLSGPESDSDLSLVSLKDLPCPNVNIKTNKDVKRSDVPETSLEDKYKPSIVAEFAEERIVPAEGDAVLVVERETRDLGVSDEVWSQLGIDKGRAKQRKIDLRDIRNALDLIYQEVKTLEDATAETSEREKALDAARESWKKTKKALDEKEREAQEEKEAQEKLIGRCYAGYQWIKQDNGYRCAGGVCFVTFEELEKL